MLTHRTSLHFQKLSLSSGLHSLSYSTLQQRLTTGSLRSSTASMALDDLPAELIDNIIEHVPPYDLTKLACVSKKYQELAQSALWRSIELHRQDAHDHQFGLSTAVKRSYLDEKTDDPWSYRDLDGKDTKFTHHNTTFMNIVRSFYGSAGVSETWNRLSGFVRHLCLTITADSPIQVWDMILSLPQLVDLHEQTR